MIAPCVRTVLPLIGALLAATAVARPLAPFRSLCIPEKATGFNWESAGWVNANFKPQRKLLIQKVDVKANASKPVGERYLLCEEPTTVPITGGSITKACYAIREHGRPPAGLDGEMCYESFVEGQVKSIDCRRVTFLPDGPYIELPWHMNIERRPADNYKDSLVLAVGTCSVVSE